LGETPVDMAKSSSTLMKALETETIIKKPKAQDSAHTIQSEHKTFSEYAHKETVTRKTPNSAHTIATGGNKEDDKLKVILLYDF